MYKVAIALLLTASAALAAEKPVEIVLSPFLNTPLRTLKARVGGKERVFLFDSGGGGTFLSKPAAEEMQLETWGRGSGFTHDGHRVDAPKAGPLEVSIGAFTRRDEVGVLDLEPFLPGTNLGGIVSLETFAPHAITIDLAANRLWVETPESFAARRKAGRETEARIAHQSGGASVDLFVAIQGKHGKLWFEADSGNVAPVLIAPYALRELGLDPIPNNTSRAVKLDFPGLGPIDVTATSKEMIHDGLLNAQFFLDHVVTIDLAAGRAWIAATAR